MENIYRIPCGVPNHQRGGIIVALIWSLETRLHPFWPRSAAAGQPSAAASARPRGGRLHPPCQRATTAARRGGVCGQIGGRPRRRGSWTAAAAVGSRRRPVRAMVGGPLCSASNQLPRLLFRRGCSKPKGATTRRRRPAGGSWRPLARGCPQARRLSTPADGRVDGGGGSPRLAAAGAHPDAAKSADCSGVPPLTCRSPLFWQRRTCPRWCDLRPASGRSARGAPSVFFRVPTLRTHPLRFYGQRARLIDVSSLCRHHLNDRGRRRPSPFSVPLPAPARPLPPPPSRPRTRWPSSPLSPPSPPAPRGALA